jgi:hypothetical protein
VKTPPDVLIAASPGLGYFVQSRSVPGAYRLVADGGCTCPATTSGCWHVAAVLELVRKQERERHPEFYARLDTERVSGFDAEKFIG